jgi:glutamine amidotransferase
MVKVTIIDYGIGNLLSVSRAFEYCGAEVILADSYQKIEEAELLVLPGVGAFANGMAGLSERGLVDSIRKYAASGRLFLGICLGMQLMMETSEEFGKHLGLGLIKGTVQAMPNTGVDGVPHKIPYIGWNELICPPTVTSWKGSILSKLLPGDSTYFVHSFTCVPEDEDNRLADCYYDGQRISAAIKKGNLYGCQFHPEKSGEVGLNIIREFLALYIGDKV